MSDIPTAWVQPTEKGRVAIWAQGDAYEDGELWIAWAGDSPDPPAAVEVPLTSDVNRALARGSLVRVTKPSTPRRRAPKPKEGE